MKRQTSSVQRARSRRRTPRSTLAVVSEQLRRPTAWDSGYAEEVLSGIQTEAQQAGHRVLLHLLAEGEASIEETLRSLRDDVDGVICAGSGYLSDSGILRLAAARLPIVLVDNDVADHPLHCVVADHVTAGYLATKRLLSLGHTRIGLLTGAYTHRSLRDRRKGYLHALIEFGVPLDRTLLAPPTTCLGSQGGYRQMQRLLELGAPPSAVVALSDQLAFGALEAMKERGLQVPSDMALVAIDGSAESAHTTPPLTTVSVPRADLGAEAVRRLLAVLHQEAPLKTKTVLYVHLITRASCGAPAAMRGG